MSLTTGAAIQPYLFFNGRCEEAIEFYRAALDAQVDMVLRFKDAPDAPPPGTVPPGFDNKIMHSSFRVGSATVMASDGCEPESGFRGFSLALTVPTETEAKQVFAALKEGGKVQMDLGKTFWSPCFGMLTDQFGVAWMVSVPDETSR